MKNIRQKNKRISIVIIAFLVFAILYLAYITACSNKKEPVKKPPIPVVVSNVVQKPVPLQLTAIGNVEAYSTINVKSQIGGVLSHIHFREGQDVKKRDILFTIDPRPYEAALKQAEANLARDTAQMENAREDARRYAELVKKGYVAKQQYDQVRTNAIVFEATVEADRANVENAKLQLSYCYIHANINGRTGNLLVNQGNLIKASDDKAMVTINQIQPIYVNFAVPEQYLADIKKYIAQHELKVAVYINKTDTNAIEGILTFVDNTVDNLTGTIKLKGTFENRDKRLWPGQFVNVALTLAVQPDAVVVPSQAVQIGQQGQYVFMVKSDQTVESRPVTVSRTFNNESIIEKGLAPGDVVVTDGHLRLLPGAKVSIQNNTQNNHEDKAKAR